MNPPDPAPGMTRYVVELCRPVDGGDFDAISNQPWTQKEARENIEPLLVHLDDAQRLTLVCTVFLEFDSPNPDHACGYWEGHFDGPEGIEIDES